MRKSLSYKLRVVNNMIYGTKNYSVVRKYDFTLITVVKCKNWYNLN